jgi:hypothetical protein
LSIKVVGRSAIISRDGKYRYRLERTINTGNPRKLGVLMVNPSTADAEVDDPTIRRVLGFMNRLGFGTAIVGNKFAQRTPHVKELAVDPIVAEGPENDKHLRAIMEDADSLLVAWGPVGKLHHPLRQRWKDVVRLADAAGKTMYCLGTAQDGHPRHPLMLANDAPFVEWPVPWFLARGRNARQDGRNPALVAS